MCAPDHLTAMVVSVNHEDKAVLNASEGITGNHLVCPGSRRLDGQACQKAGAAYLLTSCLAEWQKARARLILFH
jgi:hypothetical protein